MKKGIGVLIALLCFLNLVAIDLFMLNGKINISLSSEIAQLIVSLINLCFVVWIYFRDEVKHKNTEVSSVKRFWYHDVIIKDNIMNVQEMFILTISSCEDIIKADTTEKLKEIFSIVKDSIGMVNNTLGSICRGVDSDFATSFSAMLMEFEDGMTSAGAKLFLKQIEKKDFIEQINLLQGKVYKLMLEYDIKSVS